MLTGYKNGQASSMASISEMIVEQTVMSRSTFVNFRRFSGGAVDGVEVPVRRVERVDDAVASFDLGEGAAGGVGGDTSLSLSTGDDFFDDFSTATGSSLVSSLPSLSLLVELLLSTSLPCPEVGEGELMTIVFGS